MDEKYDAQNDAQNDARYDAVVVGGGPAGLQATLTLARVHRRVLMVDSGHYRNDPAGHMHNVVTHDGTPPEEFRAAARKELAAYDTATVRDVAVSAIAPADGGFRVELGDEVVHTRGVVLATGVTDTLPTLPGLPGLFGTVAAHCPFCHGHEFAGEVIGVAVAGEHAQMVERMLRPVGSAVVIVPPAELAAVHSVDDGLELERTDGTREHVAGLFISPTPHQRAPFAAQLGCGILPSGGVEIDGFGCTTVPGVYAAGDMAHTSAMPGPLVSLAAAIAAGQIAAAAVVRELLGD